MAAKRTKAKYHHGDLRRALIEAALAILAKDGARGLSLREVARKVGVTQTAPYHHFPTREALVAAVAAEGFAGLVADPDPRKWPAIGDAQHGCALCHQS